jgi:hypothetical protein
LQRLAAAHPDTVDAVFRKILRRRDFTWAEHGEALMRRRKAWYYRREPRPGVTVIGDRLLELAFGGHGYELAFGGHGYELAFGGHG